MLRYETQKCKDIRSTVVQAEIINFDSLCHVDLKKSPGNLFWFHWYFVNYYNTKARCKFCTNARFLINIASTSQTALSGSQHSLGWKSDPLLLRNNVLDEKLSDALALPGFSMFGLAFLFLCQSRN